MLLFKRLQFGFLFASRAYLQTVAFQSVSFPFTYTVATALRSTARHYQLAGCVAARGTTDNDRKYLQHAIRTHKCTGGTYAHEPPAMLLTISAAHSTTRPSHFLVSERKSLNAFSLHTAARIKRGQRHCNKCLQRLEHRTVLGQCWDNAACARPLDYVARSRLSWRCFLGRTTFPSFRATLLNI